MRFPTMKMDRPEYGILLFSAGCSLLFHASLFMFNSGHPIKQTAKNITVLLNEPAGKAVPDIVQTAEKPVFKAPQISSVSAWQNMPDWLTSKKMERPVEALPDFFPENDVDRPAKWLSQPDFDIENLQVTGDVIATITLSIDATGLVQHVEIDAPELTDAQRQALQNKLYKAWFTPAWRHDVAVNSSKVIVLSQQGVEVTEENH